MCCLYLFYSINWSLVTSIKAIEKGNVCHQNCEQENQFEYVMWMFL